ncbi:MAG: tyrosine--tRNA ligase [Patescibacteria group bacterium]|nr:tyrosine--tRNA ligase [Patescibacteria group bacterium]
MEFLSLLSKNDPETLHKTLYERFLADWKGITPHELLELLHVKIEQALTFDELADRLNKKKKISVKLGIDPTGPDVHLGHLVPIMLLRQFQKAGHVVNLIIGDFTAMIGDPSGRNTQREALTSAQVAVNKKTYLKQIGPYLDVKTARIHHNSKWLSKLTAKRILADLQMIPASSVLQREDFRTRLETGDPLSMAELLYSYLQGTDSVELVCDIEVGGRDQFLNLALGRDLMRVKGMEPQINLTTPVLEGTDGSGKKMSKSYGNYIALTMSAEDIFGKTMSIPDTLITPYFKAFADIRKTEISYLEELIRQNPLEMKKQLAQFMVAIATKKLKEALVQREAFEKKFSKKEFDVDLPTLVVAQGTVLFEALKQEKGVTKASNTELFRLFESGAVRVVDPIERALSVKDSLDAPCVIRVGKKLFLKIEIE